MYIALNGTGRPDNYTTYLTTENPNLKVIFLNRLTRRVSELSYKLLEKIDADLNVTLAPNPEIGMGWFPLAIALKYDVAIP